MTEYVYGRKKINSIIAIMVLCALLLAGRYDIQVYAGENSSDVLRDISSGTVDFFKNTYAGGGKSFITKEVAKGAGNSATDWIVIALSRLGAEDNYDLYLEGLEGYVNEKYQKEGGLSQVKATEYHRIALAILACGGNPESVGNQKINLIKDGIYDRGLTAPLDEQGINGEIWALITIDAGNYNIPEGAYYDRDKIIESIISKQLENGGFGLIPEEMDVDVTAMAVTALSNYYEENKEYKIADKNSNVVKSIRVKETVDKAVEALSKLQLDDGDYETGGEANASSTSQVIIALSCLKIDILNDERFIKNGNTLADGLMKYKMEDGGFYRMSGDEKISNVIDSEQALLAICAMIRENESLNKLYDFSDENIHISNLENNENLNRKYIIYIAVAAGILMLTAITIVAAKKYGKIKPEK